MKIWKIILGFFAMVTGLFAAGAAKSKEVKKLQIHKNKNKKEITNAKRKLTRTQNEIKKMETAYENDDVDDAADFLRKFSKSK